jgi:hypothetical protein
MKMLSVQKFRTILLLFVMLFLITSCQSTWIKYSSVDLSIEGYYNRKHGVVIRFDSLNMCGKTYNKHKTVLHLSDKYYAKSSLTSEFGYSITECDANFDYEETRIVFYSCHGELLTDSEWAIYRIEDLGSVIISDFTRFLIPDAAANYILESDTIYIVNLDNYGFIRLPHGSLEKNKCWNIVLNDSYFNISPFTADFRSEMTFLLDRTMEFGSLSVGFFNSSTETVILNKIGYIKRNKTSDDYLDFNSSYRFRKLRKMRYCE